MFIQGGNNAGKCWAAGKSGNDAAFLGCRNSPCLMLLEHKRRSFQQVFPLTFLKDVSLQKGAGMLFSWSAVCRMPLNGISCQI